MNLNLKAELIIGEIADTRNPELKKLMLGDPKFSGSVILFVEPKLLEGFKEGDRVIAELVYQVKAEPEYNASGKVMNRAGDRQAFIDVVRNKRLIKLEHVSVGE